MFDSTVLVVLKALTASAGLKVRNSWRSSAYVWCFPVVIFSDTSRLLVIVVLAKIVVPPFKSDIFILDTKIKNY